MPRVFPVVAKKDSPAHHQMLEAYETGATTLVLMRADRFVRNVDIVCPSDAFADTLKKSPTWVIALYKTNEGEYRYVGNIGRHNGAVDWPEGCEHYLWADQIYSSMKRRDLDEVEVYIHGIRSTERGLQWLECSNEPPEVEEVEAEPIEGNIVEELTRAREEGRDPKEILEAHIRKQKKSNRIERAKFNLGMSAAAGIVGLTCLGVSALGFLGNGALAIAKGANKALKGGKSVKNLSGKALKKIGEKLDKSEE